MVVATAAPSVSAYDSSVSIEAANMLASKGIINDHAADPAAYNLGQNVLRQEIAAVTMGVASLTKKTTCDNEFSDVSATTPNTWACYVVETLRDNGMIAANAKFNPESNITKAEALGRITSYNVCYTKLLRFKCWEGVVNRKGCNGHHRCKISRYV